MSDTNIGSIKITGMIWTAVSLSLAALYICWRSCDMPNPTIMDTAMEYPFTIIFRVGMMYSLFILFLVTLFIKWWLDSSQVAHKTRVIIVFGVIALAAYGLFVSTIDRKRINYTLAEWAVFVAAVSNFVTISTIMCNIKHIRKTTPYFIKTMSWFLKKLIYLVYFTLMVAAAAIYFGQLDIHYKGGLQYGILISTYLFYWTFVIDLKKYQMDIVQMPKEEYVEE